MDYHSNLSQVEKGESGWVEKLGTGWSKVPKPGCQSCMKWVIIINLLIDIILLLTAYHVIGPGSASWNKDASSFVPAICGINSTIHMTPK